MGVHGLWDVLSEAARIDVPVSKLAGKTIAVDLSSWIVEFSTSPAKSQVGNILIRNLFFRVSELLKTGLQLVFVLDGVAPDLKADVLAQRQQTQFGAVASTSSVSLNRVMLNTSAAKCVELLQSMGLPCVNSLGEAEATCAYLNQEKMVDGCITGDGDFFCYGGQTCYRRLRKEGKIYIVDEYESGIIQEKLGLCQAELIALALLLGSDYDKQGVKYIGKLRALTLLKGFHAHGVDVLDRMSGWHGNTELDSIEDLINKPGHRANHCKKCQHLGRVTAHRESGCVVCATEIDCRLSCDILCDCDWHKQRQHEEKYKVEVSVRRKAFDNCSTKFPDQRIIQEYQHGGKQNSQNIKPADLCRTQINKGRLCCCINSQLHWDTGTVMEKVVPLLINVQLRGKEIGLGDSTCDLQFSPIRILKECREKHVDCYEVSWRESSDDEASPKKASVNLKTEKCLFTQAYPHVVEQFLEINTAKKAARAAKKPKRKRDEPGNLANQPKILSFTKVRKRLFSTEIDSSSAFSNITNSVPKSLDTGDTKCAYDLPDIDHVSSCDLPDLDHVSSCDLPDLDHVSSCDLPDLDTVGSSDLQPMDTSPSVYGDGSLRRSPRRSSGPGLDSPATEGSGTNTSGITVLRRRSREGSGAVGMVDRTEDNRATTSGTTVLRRSCEDIGSVSITGGAVSRGKRDGKTCTSSKRKLAKKSCNQSTIKRFFSTDKL